MTRRTRPFVLVAVALLGASTALEVDSLSAAETENGDVLASVNGEPIFFDDFLHYVRAFHQSAGATEGRVAMPDPGALLERIINARLVHQEARAVGLDELPEITRQMEAGRAEILKQMVIEERVNDITEGDPIVVEQIVRQAVREVEVQSAVFTSEKGAGAFASAVRDGGDFMGLAEAAREKGLVASIEPPTFLQFEGLLPGVKQMLDPEQVGFVSHPFPLETGYAVLQWVGERFPEDAEVRADAEEQALVRRRQAALLAYSVELRDEYATVDEDLVASLDHESEGADLEALRGDERVVAEIKGGRNVTIAEVTDRLEQKFFHGFERAVARQEVNSAVEGILDRVILERAIGLEGKRLGIEELPAFQASVRAQEEGILFSAFVSKVINPDVEVGEEALQAFFETNRSDYSTPEMMAVDGLAFAEREAAEAALEKLRQGADLDWMRANAPGQIDSEEDPEVLQPNGRWFAVPSLPEGIRDAVAGASPGDVRFFEDTAGRAYALLIRATQPPQAREFEEVREEIFGEVAKQSQRVAMEHWLALARAASEIEIRTDSTTLGRRLGLGAGEGS